jgi:hypothetical protein
VHSMLYRKGSFGRSCGCNPKHPHILRNVLCTVYARDRHVLVDMMCTHLALHAS